MLRLIGSAALLVALGAHAQDFRDSFMAVTPENFDSGGEISRQFHLSAESYLRMTTIARRGPPRALPSAPLPGLTGTIVRHRDGRTSFADYVASDALIDGVIVVQAGRVLFEAYPRMQPWQRHFAWSVTKVVTSTALAVLAERGEVDMRAPVDRYLPALRDSAWAGIPLQNIADMASGIDCLDSDGYQDKRTCVYTMEESLGITAPTGRQPDFMAHLKGMQMHREAGTKNEYVSANTNVLALVIEAVTGKPYARVLENVLWQRIGATADALMAISADGYAYASGGLHARLRDVAHFGKIFSNAGQIGVLSRDSIRTIQQGGIALDPQDVAYLEPFLGEDLPERASWQWDLVWADGALFKGGYSGQGLYVDPQRELVVAWFGTGLNYSDKINDMLPVARQLARSGLFDEGASSP